MLCIKARSIVKRLKTKFSRKVAKNAEKKYPIYTLFVFAALRLSERYYLFTNPLAMNVEYQIKKDSCLSSSGLI